MELSKLLTDLSHKEIHGRVDVEIEGLAYDSRQVRPGDLFVAIKGLDADGHDFIPQALERGAVAVVVQDAQYMISLAACRLPLAPCILVPDSRQALAHLAAAFHDYPARKLRVIGVTGTDGKTTTVELIRSILAAAGYKTGMIGTVEALIGDERCETGLHVTTPDALQVQGYLARMVEAGTEYAVLETTSHGLAQHRVTACDFDVAVLTNITHEHLDYHKTFEDYREAKARLFRDLARSFRKPDTPKTFVLNADDSSFEHLRHIPADRHLTYGLEKPADITAREIAYTPAATIFTAVTPDGEFAVRTELPGSFNVYNILAAIAVGVSQRVPFEAMQKGIQAMPGVPGRMERITPPLSPPGRGGQDFTVIVDFAHTPNGFQRVLETVREMTDGQVIIVFGSAGLRDVAKRPIMGEIAGKLADRVVITAEDPRTEDLDAIIAQIAAGCERAGRREGEDYWRIGDRGEAIEFAVKMAQAGDLVIVTGKGHERTMCFGTTEYPWDDREAVREALNRKSEIENRKSAQLSLRAQS
ncbi:MAG: UDP-N-acetylmuramoyl-L-alanyl-D-glutamate--2,6-diaminopimelate ligase [Chloroflexi bacterium]|nr:UDP-N-acetylmuramoyl-L-alanyl-D-glutamate--2,6-diaminopimelate ligase [Chloroflexota bacterium]